MLCCEKKPSPGISYQLHISIAYQPLSCDQKLIVCNITASASSGFDINLNLISSQISLHVCSSPAAFCWCIDVCCQLRLLSSAFLNPLWRMVYRHPLAHRLLLQAPGDTCCDVAFGAFGRRIHHSKIFFMFLASVAITMQCCDQAKEMTRWQKTG